MHEMFIAKELMNDPILHKVLNNYLFNYHIFIERIKQRINTAKLALPRIPPPPLPPPNVFLKVTSDVTFAKISMIKTNSFYFIYFYSNLEVFF